MRGYARGDTHKHTEGAHRPRTPSQSAAIAMLRAESEPGGLARGTRTAGKDDATPNPMPIADDQRRAFEGMAMSAPETMQQMVFM